MTMMMMVMMMMNMKMIMMMIRMTIVAVTLSQPDRAGAHLSARPPGHGKSWETREAWTWFPNTQPLNFLGLASLKQPLKEGERVLLKPYL